jgi:hypothetical protein
VLTGIIFVLKTGIPWEELPQEMGCGSGMTCWRRLRQWQEQGVGDRIHQVLLDPLARSGPDRLRSCRRGQRLDPGAEKGDQVGPNPTDRRKPAARRHLLTDANGVPIVFTLSGGPA